MEELNKHKVLIREQYLDPYGHVNNAAYLTLYEEARWEAISLRGYGFKDIHRLGQGPVILEVTLKFLQELRLREEITITTQMVDYPGKVGHLQQKMLKSDGTVASEALFTFGLFDLKARKLIEPTSEWKKAIGWV